MEAGRERIDVGHGYGAYANNLGYGVYAPDGWKVGDRKTLAGARSLAQRTAQKVQERDSVQECDNCTEEGPTQPIMLELPQGGEWIDLMVCPACYGRLTHLRAR